MDLESFGNFARIGMLLLIVNAIQNSLVTMPLLSINPLIKDKQYLYLNNVKLVQFLFCVLLGLSAFVGFYALAKYHFMWAKDLTLIFPFVVISYVSQEFLRKFFVATLDTKSLLITDIISNSIRLFFVFYIYFSDYDVNLLEIFSVYFISYCLAIVYFLRIFVFNISLIERNFIKRHINMSKYLFPSAILQWTSVNFSLLMASFLLSSISVAVLRVGQAFLSIANVLSQIMENILPRSFGINLNKDCKQYLNMNFVIGVYLKVLPLVPVMILMVIYSKELIVFIFGDQYSDFHRIIWWNIAVSVILILQIPLRIALRAIESPRDIFVAFSLSTMISLLLFYPLLSIYDFDGVMMCTLISYLVLLCYMFYAFLKNGVSSVKN